MRIINNNRMAAATGERSLLRPTSKNTGWSGSALWNRLCGANERIEIMLDLVHRQATTGLYDHAMLDALVEHLSERGAVEGGQLENLWRDRMAEHSEELSEQERFEHCLERMLGGFGGENFDLFARLLDTGADSLSRGGRNEGFAIREGFVLDPSNSVLAFLHRRILLSRQ